MKKRQADSEILNQARDLINKPFTDCGSIQLLSEAEAEEEVTALLDMLGRKSDWDKKCKAMERSVALINGGALSYNSFQLPLILGCVSKLLSDVRTTVIKGATRLIAASVQVMKSDFVQCIDYVIPGLFKPMNCGKIFIVGCCKFTILSIVENCQRARTMRYIMNEASSKAVINRQIVVEAIRTALRTWSPTLIASINTEITKRIEALSSDPSAEVREAARSLIPRAAPKTPEQTCKKNIPRTTRMHSYSTVKPIMDIAKVMPPSSETEAEEFCRLLSIIAKSEALFVLENLEFAVPESIIAASRMTSHFVSLIPHIPKLFDEFREEFEPRLADVIAATGSNKRVLKRAVQAFGVEAIITQFIQSSLSQAQIIEFFTVLVSEGYVESLADEVQAFLKPMLEEHASIVLEKFVVNVEDELDIILETHETSDFGKTCARLLDLMKNDTNLRIAGKAHKCLSILTKKADDLVPFLMSEQHEQQAIIFLASCSNAELTEPAVTEILHRNTKCENVTVRRCATQLIQRNMCLL